MSEDAEHALWRRWRDQFDISAARQLTANHLHLVVRIARSLQDYDLSLEDLVGEGQLGLMRAVCQFDPDGDVCFTTYAIAWIHGTIQTHILRNRASLGAGSTGSTKNLPLSPMAQGPFSAAC